VNGFSSISDNFLVLPLFAKAEDRCAISYDQSERCFVQIFYGNVEKPWFANHCRREHGSAKELPVVV
jgi:hypothetical protein